MFSSVKPGDVVHYTTPQGQYGKGKAVLTYDTHVVVNRGKGQPQVVNDKNYVKHVRGGKVIGAVLSKVAAHDKYLKGVASTKASNAVAKAVSPYKKVGDPQDNASRAFGWTKTNEDHVPYEVLFRKDGEKKRDVVHAPRSPEGSNRGHDEAIAKVAKKHGVKTSDCYMVNSLKEAEDTSASGTFAKLSLSAAAGPNDQTRKEIERIRAARKFGKIAAGLQKKKITRLKEDSKDVEGKAERVAKTKKHKKKLVNELNTNTLVSYVSKAIADRKARGAAEIGRLRTNRPEYYVNDNGANKKIEKRSAGIKTAVAKIASKLPAEPLAKHTAGENSKHGGWGLNEVTAPGKEDWVRANKARFIDKYGKEKGLKILYAKAWKDSKNESVSEGLIKKIKRGLAGWGNGSNPKEMKDYHKNADDKTLVLLARSSKQPTPTKHSPADLQQKLIHRELKKRFVAKEARENEYSANIQLAGQVRPKQPGHYLMRDGRKLSGPHTPEQAVKSYKALGDSKGVKIVHVKEGVEIDVTAMLMETENKYDKAAQKAIKLARKNAKGNKHVDTEPKLNLPDKGTGGPMEGSESGERNDRIP